MTSEETGSFTVSAQHRVGAALVALSLVGMLLAGVWLSADSFAGLAHWSGVALVQCVYAALIAYFLFTVLREKYAVSFTLDADIGRDDVRLDMKSGVRANLTNGVDL